MGAMHIQTRGYYVYTNRQHITLCSNTEETLAPYLAKNPDPDNAVVIQLPPLR